MGDDIITMNTIASKLRFQMVLILASVLITLLFTITLFGSFEDKLKMRLQIAILGIVLSLTIILFALQNIENQLIRRW
jgi:uncharacterized membrane protein YesL